MNKFIFFANNMIKLHYGEVFLWITMILTQEVLLVLILLVKLF